MILKNILSRFQLFISISLASLFFVFSCSYALDDHFFRASWYPKEPRFERNLLTTLEAPLRYGSTHSAYNRHGHTVPLFDLHGTHALAELSKGADLDSSNPTDKLFIDLTQEAALSNDPSFGSLSFHGKERLLECFLTAEQNLYHGFFVSALLPLRLVEIKDTQWYDLTNPQTVTPTWNSIKNNLPSLLWQRYALSLNPKHRTSVSCDGYLLVGLTHNDETTTIFDFVDTTVQAGLLIPGSATWNATHPFDVFSTANGHIGFPVRAMLSGGLFEWLTLGGSFDTTFFAPKKQIVRLKTSPDQSGLLFLVTDKAQVHQGPIWNTSTFLKVDHIGDVFSLLLGYSYAKKTSDSISSCTKNIPCSIVNSDHRLEGWTMHTLHFVGEYDFSQEDKRFGPRVGLFYDKILAGESIMKNSMGGGLFGLEIALDLP